MDPIIKKITESTKNGKLQWKIEGFENKEYFFEQVPWRERSRNIIFRPLRGCPAWDLDKNDCFDLFAEAETYDENNQIVKLSFAYYTWWYMSDDIDGYAITKSNLCLGIRKDDKVIKTLCGSDLMELRNFLKEKAKIEWKRKEEELDRNITLNPNSIIKLIKQGGIMFTSSHYNEYVDASYQDYKLNFKFSKCNVCYNRKEHFRVLVVKDSNMKLFNEHNTPARHMRKLSKLVWEEARRMEENEVRESNRKLIDVL
ncbi:MAG: hypothetical protein US76_02020 [Parcubacteria group bacterium GW2011_GWA2_38_13b]|nr:MAG: hypothetical protein US76_02020 [Parcubacteria group bacterium GW2011_GWA2_38_13b]